VSKNKDLAYAQVVTLTKSLDAMQMDLKDKENQVIFKTRLLRLLLQNAYGSVSLGKYRKDSKFIVLLIRGNP